MIHQFALVVLFALLHTVSSSDCQWHDAIEFWSNVTCSMEDIKTVNFHDVLESVRKDSIFLDQCVQALVYDIARKCETTIISRIYTLRDIKSLVPFVSNNDVSHRSVKQPSIWKIISGDALPSRVMPSAAGKIRIQSDETYDRNTRDVHVILARDIYSFDQISKDDTTFKWNSHDRFIVLIARFPKKLSNELSSRIGDILKTLWYKRKVYKIFVSEAILINDTVRINQIVHTYNPFAKVNDSGS